MLKYNKLTKTRFKKWAAGLERKEPFNYVSNTDCILAAFLREELKEKNVSVSAGYFRLNPNIYDIYLIPRWCFDFLSDVRGYGPRYSNMVSIRKLKYHAKKL